MNSSGTRSPRPHEVTHSTEMQDLIEKLGLDPTQTTIESSLNKKRKVDSPYVKNDLKQEWINAMKVPISHVASRFKRLKLD